MGQDTMRFGSHRGWKHPPKRIQDDRLKLVYPVIQAFKATIKDDPFGLTKSWTGDNVCKYRGFLCDRLPDFQHQIALAGVDFIALAGVDFNHFKFSGKDGELRLDNFIEKLPDLVYFHANSNNFTGTVPQMKNSRYLSEIDLSNNRISGPAEQFPFEFLSLKNLTFLDLRFNSFAGTVPPQVFNLDVQVVSVNDNKPSLQRSALFLTFANFDPKGPIPRDIRRATEDIVAVRLSNNYRRRSTDQCFPYEIGYLKNATLFDASRSFVTGLVPQSFGCLEKIEILDLAGNYLYGEVPEMVCKLASLRNLSLAENYFTQVGSVCRKLIAKKYVDVKKNCILDLPNQRSKGECYKFFSKPRRSCDNEKYMNYVPCREQRYNSFLQAKESVLGEEVALASSEPISINGYGVSLHGLSELLSFKKIIVL